MTIASSRPEKQGQIAVVEELPDNIYSIRFILQSLGYRVDSVSSQKGYLENLEKISPDLIIIDMLIPAGGGLDVITCLKNSSLQNISAMAITADAVAIEEEELLKAGFDDVLSKPYTVAELQKKLHNHLR
jgi:CheY-like chemotaxis protein